jgi:hypothetical protein
MNLNDEPNQQAKLVGPSLVSIVKIREIFLNSYIIAHARRNCASNVITHMRN